MDSRRFDELIRALGASASRRGLVGGLTGGMLAFAADALRPGLIEAKNKKTKKHRNRKKGKKKKRGGGAAAECQTATECPDPANPCRVATCVGGTCGDQLVPGAEQQGAACDTGELGRCAAGTLQCAERGELTCVRTLDPIPETCNGIDDDCDGETDEGDAANLCPVRPNSTASCFQGQCLYLCIGGFLDCDGDPSTPCDTFVFGNDPNNCGGCNTDCSGPCGSAENPGVRECLGGSCLCTIQL